MDNSTRVSYLAASFLLATSAIPQAAAAAAGPRYTYVDIAYVNTEIDDDGLLGEDPDGDGIGIGGSVAVADMVHLFASYGMAELEVFDVDVDYDVLTFGAGVNYPLSNTVDFVGRISYVDAEVDVDGFGSADESGYGLSTGVRAMLTEQVELSGFLNYVDLGSGADETTVSIEALYSFNETFAAGLGTEFGSDSREISAGVRLYFGGR